MRNGITWYESAYKLCQNHTGKHAWMNKLHVHERSRTMPSGLLCKNEIPIMLCCFWKTSTGSQLDTVTAFSKTKIVKAGKSITLMPVFHHLSVFFSLILPLLLYQSSCSPSILQQNYLSKLLKIKKTKLWWVHELHCSIHLELAVGWHESIIIPPKSKI